MIFKYSEKIDKQCKERLDAHEVIFGEKKRIETYKVDEETLARFRKAWTPEIEEKFSNGIAMIFNAKVNDDFVCYINSTPYSMDIEDGISISASTETPIRTICHETSHYMFKKSEYVKKYFSGIDVEDAKEIFTIINNIYFQDIMEGQDIGWKVFWKQRYNFLVDWFKTHQYTR